MYDAEEYVLWRVEVVEVCGKEINCQPYSKGCGFFVRICSGRGGDNLSN